MDTKLLLREALDGLVTSSFLACITWIVARMVGIEAVEFRVVVASVILAGFAAKGWRTKSLTWPLRLPIWRTLQRFSLATTIFFGLPLAIIRIQACLVLIAAVSLSVLIIWHWRSCWNFTKRLLGLADAGTAETIRFAIFWIMSIAALIWEEPSY